MRVNPAIITLVLAACTLLLGLRVSAEDGSHWVATWGAAPQLTEPRNLPPTPGLSSNTLRQVVQVSVGGQRLRVRFSNAFGDAPATMTAAHVALSKGRGRIDPESDLALTFDNESSVTIPPGELVVSDPFDFELAPSSRVAVTIHFAETATDVTGHPGSRTTSYLKSGEAVATEDLSEAVKTVHWYILSGIDVLAGEETTAAVAILGDSITDGRGSTTDGHNRWPDNLARRLQANPATSDIAVLNQGIGGNSVLRGGLGPPALTRIERDVLEQSGVRWLIVLEGVNDIGGTQGRDAAEAIARELIEAYEEIVAKAHARGILVYGGTITPFGGSFYSAPEREAARRRVNQWIRTSETFDAVIDFDKAIRDPENPSRLAAAADSGDHLHPGVKGYQMMADAIDLNLFTVKAPAHSAGHGAPVR